VTPVQLQFKDLYGDPYTLVSEKDMKAISYAEEGEETFSFNSRMMAKKSWFG